MYASRPTYITSFLGRTYQIQNGSFILVGDVTKTFLQTELHEDDKDDFRFIYRLRNEPEKKFRFKRLPVGGESSPFVFGGVLQYHLEMTEGDEKVKQDLKNNTYVDNVMGLVPSEMEAEKFIVESTEIMEKEKFPLGTWEPNIKISNDSDRMETMLLGILWNKCDNMCAVQIEVKELETVTKKLILKTLPLIYDPLGIISPMLVEGKHLCKQAVNERKGWDKQVSEELRKKWNK